MFLNFDENLNRDICNKLNEDNVFRVTIEELAELIQAVTKMYRYKFDGNYDDIDTLNKCIENLTEEMADVLIVINRLKYIFGINERDLQKIINFKDKRTKELYEKGELS